MKYGIFYVKGKDSSQYFKKITVVLQQYVLWQSVFESS